MGRIGCVRSVRHLARSRRRMRGRHTSSERHALPRAVAPFLAWIEPTTTYSGRRPSPGREPALLLIHRTTIAVATTGAAAAAGAAAAGAAAAAVAAAASEFDALLQIFQFDLFNEVLLVHVGPPLVLPVGFQFRRRVSRAIAVPRASTRDIDDVPRFVDRNHERVDCDE